MSLLLASYLFYFGWFRKRYVISKKEGESHPKMWLERLVNKADTGFRELLKFLMYETLFSNKSMDDITGKALFDLTQMPTIQEVILNVFQLLWDNEPFTKDVQGLTEMIVGDYLNSDHCLAGFSDIVIN